MRFKLNLLAAVAMVAFGMPAKADLVFDYHLAPLITSTGTVAGPALTSLNLTVGQSVVLQIVMRDTGGPLSPTNPTIGAPDAMGNTTMNELIGWGFRLNYPQIAGAALAQHTPPVTSNANTRQGLVGFGFGNVISTGTAPPPGLFSVLRNLTLGDGAYNDGVTVINNEYLLCTVRIDALAPGVGSFNIVDSGSSDDIGTVNNPGMDAGIFDQPFLLPVTVVAVPEPTSMVLVGLAVAGIGIRARRKKTTEVVA